VIIMPLPSRYKKGFEIRVGDDVAGGIVKKSDVKHVVLEEYREYEYPTSVIVDTPRGTTKSSLRRKAKKQLEHKKKVIYTRYGNPYECDFGKVSVSMTEEGDFKVSATGRCRRSFDLPKRG